MAREIKRPFQQGDGGIYYLIKGSIRDEDFTIVAQRDTVEELDAIFNETASLDEHHTVLFVKGMVKKKDYRNGR